MELIEVKRDIDNKVFRSRIAIEKVCATFNCYHRSYIGIIYCLCCYHGSCRSIDNQELLEYNEAREIIKVFGGPEYEVS